MIRITLLPGFPAATHPEEPAVRISVIGRTDILKLQAMINRALNTAPEFGSDWFALAKDLDNFVVENKLK